MNSRRKMISVLAGLSLLCCWSAASANTQLAAIDGTKAKVSDLRATSIGIGPMQIDNGLVIIKGNQLIVLSDPSEPISEAELAGELISQRIANDQNGSSLEGAVLFNKGLSLPALGDVRARDTIELLSGGRCEGNIQAIEKGAIRIKTSKGVQTCRFEEIADIKSVRAFEFSVPMENAGKKPYITFTPTAITPAGQLHLMRATAYKEETGTHPRAKKLLKRTALAAAVLASFGIPVAVAVSTRHIGGLKGDF